MSLAKVRVEVDQQLKQRYYRACKASVETTIELYKSIKTSCRLAEADINEINLVLKQT